MYRPPENCNRVKSIRSKFENDGNGNIRTDLKIDDDKVKVLSRQLSDPVKRNIKRTPAFRLDKNLEKTTALVRVNPTNHSPCYESKVKQFSSALRNNCDNWNKIRGGETGLGQVSEDGFVKKPSSVLLKSKKNHDFMYIRSKFNENTNKNEENQRKICEVTTSFSPWSTVTEKSEATSFCHQTDEKPNSPDITSLYTKPIPKSLRNETNGKPIDIYSANTLSISDLEQPGLSDTLKVALKRPLPSGPAPKKPPRTFEHANSEKNSSFLHMNHNVKPKLILKPKTRDPRYMLSKLENALRNHKIKMSKKSMEISTTSEEDSDDSLLFRSKTKRELPEPPVIGGEGSGAFNFNCFNGDLFTKASYEKIKEPNSLFFVSCEEEPVYAEPFHEGDPREQFENRKGGNNVRNSLYYMDDGVSVEQDVKVPQKQVSLSENSSLSSFTSDLDTATSTPLEETKNLESTLKIKRIIDVFETKQTMSGAGKNDIKLEGLPDNSSSRVDELKMSLQKTLDRCFANDDNGKDSNKDSEEKEKKESVDTIINKFQTYIKTMPKYRRPRMSRDDRLFYCCLIVGWDMETPKMKFKFPPNVEIPHRIEDLCYPEAASGPLDKSNNAQCYSLVITNDKGERTFGYCRRVIPEGSTNCLPLVYCILSKHRAPRFYSKILMELESRHGHPDKLRDELINSFYCNKFPKPGDSITVDLTKINKELDTIKKLKSHNKRDCREFNEVVDSLDLTSFVYVNKAGEYGTLNKAKRKLASYENILINHQNELCASPSMNEVDGEKTELILTLHHDTRYEDADLKPLHQLPSHILLKVFASLLLERKVILISCVISKLSCCVDALQSILYPFSWPHTFIPILPQCLWDVVESPTPVVCGILSVAVINEYKIEHGIVVDLDERNILSEEGDENSILSNCMKKSWEQSIMLANRVLSEDYVHSVYLSDAYIKVFIVCLKNYKTFIVDGSFQKENFIRNGKTKGIRRFLKWFTETTLFTSFIETVINNPQSFALFDQKMEMYGSGDSNLILSKLLDWRK